MKKSHVKEITIDMDTSERISFLSHISHGIRTPLNSIMGFSKLMAQRHLNEDKQQDYIKEILKGSELLLQFVENVIDLSQFQAENYSLKIEKYIISDELKAFAKEFNAQKKEYLIEDITLYFPEEDEYSQEFFITDIFLFKKAVLRLINLVNTKFKTTEYELKYKILADEWIHFFVTPLKKTKQANTIASIDEFDIGLNGNSFDYFNFQVLKKSVEVLHGKFLLDTFNHGFSFKIPIDIREFNHKNIFKNQ
ncbi:MAG: histidine kinase dimerization/phospho-acceptor domain-containing protein [Bacteroidota bacterium]|nr:histidine kinase dimerization/phospho-acceptor domain-containing protein [Bacteroidota bacterium]